MRKAVIIYVALVVLVVFLAAWRLGAFNFLTGGGSAEAVLGGETVSLEVAASEEDRAQGLGGRDSLGENEGMIFVFDEKQEHSFWMYEMNFPIDIIFIDENTIVDIEENVPPPDQEDPNRAQLPTYSPDSPVNYVIEVPAGFVAEHEVQVGDTVEISGL